MSIQKLKEKFQQGANLVEEFERSKEAESCDYQLVKQPDSNYRYFLVRFSDQKVVADGTAKRICSYMNLRNIQSEAVLDFDIKEAN